jgi:hypothetical protein
MIRCVGSILGAACVVAALTSVPVAGVRAASDPSPAFFTRRFGTPDVTLQRVATRPDGTILVAGRTPTADLPAGVDPPVLEENGSYVFLTALAPDGTPRWTRYLSFPRYDAAVQAIAVAADGAVWLAMDHWDRGFPVARFESDGTPSFVTTVGGAVGYYDTPRGIVVAENGDAVVVGTTASPDFPVVNAFQPTPGGGGMDGFVTRVLRDGSGLAWSSFVGGGEFDGVTAAAIDPSGDILAVLQQRGPTGEHWSGIYSYDPVLALDLVRIHGDGTLVGTTPLPHGERGGILSLAAPADGGVLLGGAAMYGSADANYGTRRGFVARVAPGATTFDAMWRADGVDVVRIGVAPDGRIVARLWRPSYDAVQVSVVVLDPSLTTAATVLPEAALRTIDDAAVGPDGSVSAVGRGLPAFDPASRTEATAFDWYVARGPLPASAAPSRIRVVRPGLRSVDLAWTPGDPVLRYEVERLDGKDADRHFTFVADAPADARHVRIGGLRPGESYTFRLVSVFASGERVAVVAPAAFTRPEQITDIRADVMDGRRIRVAWDVVANGAAGGFEVERKLGDGAFQRVPWSPYPGWLDDELAPNVFEDALPPLDGVVVTYRVRAVTEGSRLKAPWSRQVSVTTTNSTLRVRQRSGQTFWMYGRQMRFVIEGTFEPLAGRPMPAFDPSRSDLFVTAGDASVPGMAHPQSYDWEDRGNGLFVAYVDTDDAHEGECGPDDGAYTDWFWVISIRPSAGWLRVEGFACKDGFKWDSDRLVLGISLGGLAGGDLRTWTRTPGHAPSLVLR